MALFKDTEKSKKDKVENTQKIASLKKVIDYVLREDKVGTIDAIITKNNGQVNLKDESSLIEEMLERKDNMLFKYITQDKKTEEKLITGINCRASSAFDEMMLTKKLYNKTDGRQFKHFVHSYSKHEKKLTPEMAHEITLKLLEHEKFKGFQILVTTHVDTDTLHSHIAVNSVNMETGLKWKHSLGDLIELTDYSNKLCYEYGLEYSFVDNRNSKFINRENFSSGEYRARKKGKSWKYELWLTINECMKISTSKEEFIKNMNNLGYKVRWEDNRKNITFTLPNGRKCNNDKLHPPEKYTKEALIKRFQLNKQFQERNAKFKAEKKSQDLQNLILETIRRLENNPKLGDKNYPLTYLEGQALKEKMIEEAKGRGFDWEKEQER